MGPMEIPLMGMKRGEQAKIQREEKKQKEQKEQKEQNDSQAKPTRQRKDLLKQTLPTPSNFQIVDREINFNRIFLTVNQSRHRYRILKGSAGSGKSVNIAQEMIVKLMNPDNVGANLLCVRKTEESNRDSTFAELKSAIMRICGPAWPAMWDMKSTPYQLTCKVTGNSVIFRGMNDDKQREKVKSITFPQGKLTWIWIEEATELAEADLNILDDRLRGELTNPNLYYQVTMSFNPVSATHWIKSRFFDRQDPDVLTHHSTYLNNRFIDAAFHRRMQLRKERDPDGYRIYGLGEWGETGGLILTNWKVEDFDRTTDRFDSLIIGQDFGFNHANAILLCGWKDGELYVLSEIYEFEKDTAELIRLANHANLPKNIRMLCDSAEPDRIKMWRTAGFSAHPCTKHPGSVKAQIDYLKQIPAIHFHPDCVNTAKEASQWKWKWDRQRGVYLDEPVDFFDDAMASLRYAISERVSEVPIGSWSDVEESDVYSLVDCDRLGY